MKFRQGSLFVLVAALLVASLFTGCQPKSDKSMVATDATWPPMEYVDADKNIGREERLWTNFR